MTRRELRKAALEARRAIPDAGRRLKSIMICDNLLQLRALERAGTILSYRALPDEADLRYLRTRARVAYPLCITGGAMEARIPFGPLRRGAYDIEEPDPELSVPVPPEELDLVLVPCVAFDDRGNRLGHGAGCYDRYLPLCRNARFAAVAFEAQRLEDIQAGPWDVPMDYIVTEKGVYSCHD